MGKLSQSGNINARVAAAAGKTVGEARWLLGGLVGSREVWEVPDFLKPPSWEYVSCYPLGAV